MRFEQAANLKNEGLGGGGGGGAGGEAGVEGPLVS